MNGCYCFDQNENSSFDVSDLDVFEVQMNGLFDLIIILDQ